MSSLVLGRCGEVLVLYFFKGSFCDGVFVVMECG